MSARSFTLRSRWQRSAVIGGTFAALWAPINYLMDPHPSLVGTVIGAVVAGGLFGVLFGRLLHRMRDGAEPVLGGLSRKRRRTIARAARRGPIPSGTEERLRAFRLAQLQLGFMRRCRVLMLIGAPGLLAVFVASALLDSPLYWIAVVGWSAAGVSWFVDYRRMEGRIELLRPSDEGQLT